MAIETGQHKRETRRVRVAVHLSDGQRYRGHIFIGVGERLQDTLNDERGFLPMIVETMHGSESIVMIGKRYIVSMGEMDDSAAPTI